MSEAIPRRWLGLVLDQRNLPALRGAAERVEKALGGIDIVFANAGIQAFKPLLEMDDADWQVQIDNNPEDVAPVVVFLASDAARMVTGATYNVTGGDSAHNT